MTPHRPNCARRRCDPELNGGVDLCDNATDAGPRLAQTKPRTRAALGVEVIKDRLEHHDSRTRLFQGRGGSRGAADHADDPIVNGDGGPVISGVPPLLIAEVDSGGTEIEAVQAAAASESADPSVSSFGTGGLRCRRLGCRWFGSSRFGSPRLSASGSITRGIRCRRADTVDSKTFVVGDGFDLKRIELDHRIAHALVGSYHCAHCTVIFGALRDHKRARASALRGGEADQSAGTVVAHGGQRAQSLIVHHDPGTTTQ